ncbi:hypothetical protein, partial [Vogesella mureinivorans]|uniref:hypothetical protein n=1 Tax=Vogesella mureinivorans TaxID=657276 RepID=UPI0011CA5A29
LYEQIERPALRALPDQPFEYAEWKRAKVHPDYHIEVLHGFCGCRPRCKKFLLLKACDRTQSSVRPCFAAFETPLAGMVIRGSGPKLLPELRSSKSCHWFPDRDL